VRDGTPLQPTRLISETLSIDCSMLSGANVAKDIAQHQFSETTLGYHDSDVGHIWQQLFDCPYFRVNGVPDIAGVEVCGALKNVIALAAGFCDGLNYGSNTKAAIIRLGVEEMRNFANIFFDGIIEDTFMDSAGWADVITTCFAGRHVRCAKEFILQKQKKTWDEIEKELLGGMKLQGQVTCSEVHQVLTHWGLEDMFPLFTTTYKVAFEEANPELIVKTFAHHPTRPLKLMEETNACKLRVPVRLAKERVAAAQAGNNSSSKL